MECRANVSTTNSMDIITSMKGLLLSVVLQLLCSFCNAEITFLPGTGSGKSYQGVLTYSESGDTMDLHTICYEDSPRRGQVFADRACNNMGFVGSSSYDPYSKSSLDMMGRNLPQKKIRCEGDSFSECRPTLSEADQSCNQVVSIRCRGTCEGRCGNNNDDRKPCQCNWACVEYNDCCEDFLQECTRIQLEGTNPMEGVVVIEEKNRERNVSYVCQRGNWISFEASAACADLGYHGNATHYSTLEYEDTSRSILQSYVTCESDDTSLSQCEISDNIMTQDICTANEHVGCCKGIVGIRCTNQTVEEITLTTVDAKGSTISAPTTIETTTQSRPNGTAIKSSAIERKYIYIIIGVVCAILIIIVALLLIVRSRRGSAKQHPSANTDPTVTMGNLTSDQSVDTAPTPILALEVQCVEENTYASDPTSTHPGGGVTGTNEGGDEHDYTYVDVPPMRSQSSEDLVHSYMYADIPNRSSPDPSRDTSGVMSGGNDYGLIDNVLYGQS